AALASQWVDATIPNLPCSSAREGNAGPLTIPFLSRRWIYSRNMGIPRTRLAGIVLDAADAGELAAFYSRLLGWRVTEDEGDWLQLKPPDGSFSLSIQTGDGYVPPRWPNLPGEQQMMLHLDIEVDDLETAGEHAIALGARLADHQPQELVRVYLDPAGHPFCLFVNGG